MLCVRYINIEYSVFGGGEKGEMQCQRCVISTCVCMCVCVWETERKADRERERGSGER